MEEIQRDLIIVGEIVEKNIIISRDRSGLGILPLLKLCGKPGLFNGGDTPVELIQKYVVIFHSYIVG